MARSTRAVQRPTIRRMLETKPANVASPAAPSAIDESIPDEELGWEPLGLPRAIRSRRTFRIPVIVLSVAAAIGAYFGAQFLLRLPLAQAQDQRIASSRVLESALDAMPDLQTAAAALTADSGIEDLAAHLVTLIQVDGLAGDIAAVADRSTILTIPGFPNDDLEMLEPIKGRMGAISDRMTVIGGVLTDVVAYRNALEQMFLLPELPGPSEGPSVEVFSDRLAQMTAATVQAAALLPDGELFGEHRAEVERLLDWLPGWQAAYVEALRNDDLDEATRLRAEAVDRVDRLHSGLSEPLDTAGGWAVDAIQKLTLDIQAALILTG